MYGSFRAIVGSVAEQLGSPYTDFPFALFKYGEGGVYGWATLLGTINGSAAAIQLLSPNPVPLIDALFAWYESEPLPNFSAKGNEVQRGPLGCRNSSLSRLHCTLDKSQR